MAAPRKPNKSTGKKPAKRAAPKKAARKAKGLIQSQKVQRNKDLIAGDLDFYNRSEKKNYARRTKGNKLHPRGVPLYTLRPNGHGFMVSNDGSIRLTEEYYERLANNPDAIPRYTPIKKDGKIVKYRNTRSGAIVSPYYRHSIFGKTFNQIEDQVQPGQRQTYGTLYQESIVAQRHAALARTYDLVSSYQLLHPDMTPNQVRASIHFQGLVAELTTFNYSQYGITDENIDIADQVLGIAITTEDAKRELGRDARFKQVMVELGRRLPSDNGPVGDSDPNHIKNVVQPYYATIHGSVTYSEEEE